FFFQAEDGIRDFHVTGVQTCALPISSRWEALAEAAGKFRPRPRAGPGKPAAKPTATLATGPRPMSRAEPRCQTGLAPAANRPGPGGKPARARRQTDRAPADPPYVRKITRSLRKARCVPHKAAPAVATSDPRVNSTGAAPGRLPSSTSRTMNSTFSTGTKYVQTATASVSANIKYMLGSITRNASAVMYAWASR